MLASNAEIHLRRAKAIQNSPAAIAEYLKAIEEAVKELKAPRILIRTARRR